MTREKLVKKKAQEFASSGEFSPSLTESFIAGAEWEHKRLKEKAYEWLKKNAFYYMRQILLMETMEVEDFIEDFHIEMEE